MKKSTYAGLAIAAVAPVLLTPSWWIVPLQILGCSIVDSLHIGVGVGKSDVVKLSLCFSALFFLGMTFASGVPWPLALLAAIGSHFLGAMAARLFQELD